MAEAMDLLPNVQMMDPHIGRVVGTSPVSVRIVVFISLPFIHLVLNTYLTPRQAWERIDGAVIV